MSKIVITHKLWRQSWWLNQHPADVGLALRMASYIADTGVPPHVDTSVVRSMLGGSWWQIFRMLRAGLLNTDSAGIFPKTVFLTTEPGLCVFPEEG